MSATFADLTAAVAAYYGTGSDQWVQIARYGISSPQAIEILKQVPGVNVTVSNSGKVLGWDFDNTFGTPLSPAAAINSNVEDGIYGAGSFGSDIPANATPPSTDLPDGGMSSGAKLTGTGATIATVADRISLATAGVALGTKLGKLIDGGIYSLNPNWFDENFPTINPETWDDMASTEGGKQVIRSIFGLQNDSATMYLDERLLAQTYMMLLQQGAYNEQSTVTPSTSTHEDITQWSNIYYPNGLILSPPIVYYKIGNRSYTESASGSSPVYAVLTRSNDERYFEATEFYSKEPFTVTLSSGSSKNSMACYTSVYLGYNTYYVSSFNNWFSDQGTFEGSSSACINFVPASWSSSSNTYRKNTFVSSLIFSGTISQAGIDGVQDNPQATTYINPSQITGTDLSTVLQQLKTLYPDLFDGSIYTDVPQDDGTIERYTYIPVPYPNTNNPEQPISDDTPNINPQTDPQVTPEARPDSAEDIAKRLTNPTTNSPDTGDGNTPPATIPTGSASALYSIYNPTQGELNSFGAWLWSSNFVDQLLKLFNDPMQAIIGLHKVFAQPVISGASTIKVGYLDSGVSSNVVGNQYTTIDCGSVNISEYFGNVFDYDPFTQIYIYLPFVGIEKLDTGDVMRGRVGVKYHVDVITGACLAEISVIRDGSGGILYTFTGNCAVQYPISSGSYMGIVASLASIAGGVVGTITSGGALAPVAMGAVSGALNAHTRVQHSGGFSGNAGAMGIKKPYIIITRPQTCLADDFPAFDGYPANKTTTISACSGFIKCETCHVENVPATDAELSEIEMLLKSGIII